MEEPMPGRKHLRGVSEKEQREYEHIKGKRAAVWAVREPVRGSGGANGAEKA
jgi:hypothetical protein